MRPLDPEVKAALDQHGLTVSEETWGRLNGAGLESHSKADFSLALAQFECAIALARHLFGDGDRRTLTSGNNLAEALHSNGRVLEAITMHEDTLRERLRVLGADDYDTLMSRNNLACALKANGQLQQALTTFTECLSEHERVYGQDDPRTRLAHQKLARVMSESELAIEASDAQYWTHATTYDTAMMVPATHPISIPEVPGFTPRHLRHETLALIIERAMSIDDPGDQCLLLARELASSGATRDACVATLACCAFYAATSRIVPGALALTLRDCGRLLLEAGYPTESSDAFDFAGREFDRTHRLFSTSPRIRNFPNWHLTRAISDLGLACAHIECGDVVIGARSVTRTLQHLYDQHLNETRTASLSDRSALAYLVLRSGHALTKHARARDAIVQLERLDALELSLPDSDSVNLESLRCTCLLFMRASTGLVERLRALRERMPHESVWRRARVTFQLAQALLLKDRYADAASEFAVARHLMPRVEDQDLMEYLSLVVPICNLLGGSQADVVRLLERLSASFKVAPITAFNILAMCHSLSDLVGAAPIEAALASIEKRMRECSLDLMALPTPEGWERACLEMLHIKSGALLRTPTENNAEMFETLALHAGKAAASMTASSDQVTRAGFLSFAAQQLRYAGKFEESKGHLQRVLDELSQMADDAETARIRDATVIGIATLSMNAGDYPEAARHLTAYLTRVGARMEGIEQSADWISARQVLMASESYLLLATCYAKIGNETAAWEALENSASQGVDELLASVQSGPAMKRTPLPCILRGEVLLRVNWTTEALLVGVLGPIDIFRPRVFWRPTGAQVDVTRRQGRILEQDQCWSEISTLSFLISSACGGERVSSCQIRRALQSIAHAADGFERDVETSNLLRGIRDEIELSNRWANEHTPETMLLTCSAECLARMSRRLLEVLLPDEVRRRLSLASRISVIPGGPLSGVPLGLAVDLGDFSSLTRKAITSVPSASVFTLLRERGMDSHGVGVGSVGDPDFCHTFGSSRQQTQGNGEDVDVDEWQLLVRDGSRAYERLPRSGSESTLIANYARQGRTRPQPSLLLGAGATVAAVEALAPGKRVLHLSTHAVLGGMSDPLGSAVVLAAEELPDGTRKAGLLRLDRLLTHWGNRLAGCDLVVLSCCQTGRGVQVADSLMALPIGFLHAGARSVLATLWPVGDLTTCLVMLRFYQNYLGAHQDDRGRPDTAGREVWGKPFQPGQAMPIPQALADAKRWVREMTMKQLWAIVDYVLPPLQRKNDQTKERLKLQAMTGNLGLAGRPFEHPRYWAAFTIIGDV